MIVVSVITVCKNAGRLLEKTILSVLTQSTDNYEYIIQDGGSDDNTLDIARLYENKFKKRNVRFTINSEKDNGIYDGMNAAIDKCKGEWVIFLNAGDTFYDIKVLDCFEKIGIKPEIDLVYGHTNYVFLNNKRLIVIRKKEDVFNGKGICQQSIFYKKKILEERKFDTKYKLLADYEYLLYLIKQNYKFLYINLIVSNYDYNGISSISCEQVYKESAHIMRSYGMIYKKRRPHVYLKMKEKVIARFPILNILQVVHAELNKGE